MQEARQPSAPVRDLFAGRTSHSLVLSLRVFPMSLPTFPGSCLSANSAWLLRPSGKERQHWGPARANTTCPNDSDTAPQGTSEWGSTTTPAAGRPANLAPGDQRPRQAEWETGYHSLSQRKGQESLYKRSDEAGQMRRGRWGGQEPARGGVF